MINSPPKAGKGQMYHTTHTVWTQLFAVNLFSLNLWQKLQSLLISSLYNLYQLFSTNKTQLTSPPSSLFLPTVLTCKGCRIHPLTCSG